MNDIMKSASFVSLSSFLSRLPLAFLSVPLPSFSLFVLGFSCIIAFILSLCFIFVCPSVCLRSQAQFEHSGLCCSQLLFHSFVRFICFFRAAFTLFLIGPSLLFSSLTQIIRTSCSSFSVYSFHPLLSVLYIPLLFLCVALSFFAGSSLSYLLLSFFAQIIRTSCRLAAPL